MESGENYSYGNLVLVYDHDGIEGCKQIKEQSGKTFAQDMSAEGEYMPLSAQKSGSVDLVTPLNKFQKNLKAC